MFRHVGLGEQAGSGLSRVYASWRSQRWRRSGRLDLRRGVLEFSRAGAHHGPRLLVVPGRELGVESLIDAVAVTIASPPEVLGCLPGKVERQVVEWVELNRDVLLEYWRGGMGTDDAIEHLVRV